MSRKILQPCLFIGLGLTMLLCGPTRADAQQPRRINLPLGEAAPTTPAPSTLEAYVKSRWPLGRGTRGSAVKEMQKRLASLGFDLKADGIFGGDTMRALRAFQRDQGLEDDGFFGKASLKALGRVEQENKRSISQDSGKEGQQKPKAENNRTTVGLTGALRGSRSPSSSTANPLFDQTNDGRTLRPGSKGPLVTDLQNKLTEAGFSTPTTGRFDADTKAALKKFQASKGLKADGLFGPQTANALMPSLSIPAAAGSWMAIAKTQLGVKELSGSRNNPRIVEYHRTAVGNLADSVPWCSSFVNWVVIKAGINGTNKGNARSWLNWGQKLSKPIPGCVVVFWRDSPSSWKGHVGFYVGDAGSYVKVLGGNQGNAVTISTYPKSRVLGYRWPSNAPLPGN
jgi:uncharacterized protein (TIGR02594 family)